MKRYLLILLILSSFTYSCNVKKKVTTQTTIDTEIQNETIKREESVDIRTPKSNIFISDRIINKPSGGIQTISRTIVDPVTKQTLKLDVSESGEISIASITPADTIRISSTNTIDKSNIKSSIDEKTQVDTKVKFNLSSLISSVIGGFLGVIPGGSIIGYILLGVLAFVVFIIVRRVFGKKEKV
jgi:hypothetical protein